MKVYITKEFKFDSAHFLPCYDGKCNNIHGHTYKMQVTVSGVVDYPQTECKDAHDFMVLDFNILKSKVDCAIIDVYDHEYLNGHFICPTAEYMAMSFFDSLSKILPKDVKLEGIKLWETDTSFAEVRAE